MANEAVCCGTCPFWVAPTGSKMGTCHVDPPRPLLLGLIPNPNGGPPFPNAPSFWPMTGETDWCGRHPEFASKPIDFASIMPLDQRLAGDTEGVA